MTTRNLTMTEVARNFSEYVSRVAYRREAFILCKGRRPMAELRPVPAGRRLAELPEILRRLPRLAKGDRAAFAADVETARKALRRDAPRDPWAS